MGWFSNIIPNEVKKIVPKEVTNVLSSVGDAFTSAKNTVTKAIDNAIPNEVKKVVSDIIPNEIKPILDKVLPNELKGPTWEDVILKDIVATANKGPGVSVDGKAPTYDETLLKAFNAQLAIEPLLLNANRLYQPQWLQLQTALQKEAATQNMDLMSALYPKAAATEATYQNLIRSNELEQLRTNLPQYQYAFNALTPGYAGALAGMGQLAQQSTARANVSPALTAYEQQVGSPYGGPAIAPMAQRPPGGIYPNGLAYETPESRAVEAPPVQQAAAALPAGAAAAAAPAATTPPSLLPSYNAPQLQSVTPSITQVQPTIPLAPPLPPGVHGPQAPAPAYLAAKASEELRSSQVSQDIAKMQTLPRLTQEQAWGIQTPAGQPPMVPPPTQPGLRNVEAGSYMNAVGGPELSSGLNALNNQTVQQYVSSMPGMQTLAAQFGDQANREIAAGRSLTPEEERMAQQAARAGYAARGTALGQQSVAAEVLNRADVANQRYQQRIANAAGMAGAVQNIYQPALAQSFARQQAAEQYNLGAQQQAFQQAMGKEGILAGTQQAAFNQALQRGQAEQQRLLAASNLQASQAQIAAGALGQLQNAQAPILQAFYRQPILQSSVGAAQTMGMANQQAAGNSLFNPESPLAFQAAFLPYQSNIALQQAQIMADASKSSSNKSLFGNLAGSGIGLLAAYLCWVAREVYGSETGTWKIFRNWMLTKAPKWMLHNYIKHGPRIAQFISDKPLLKSAIRKWMDSKIAIELSA